jgi:hypothetical protein
MATSYTIGSTYSFEVYPSAILGNDFTSVIVMGIMDAATAAQTGLVDIYAAHANMYSYLPTPKPVADDATSYNYLKLKLSDSTTPIVLGIPFINDSTVELVTAQQITVVVTGVENTDVTTISNLLAAAGYTVSSATIASTTTST